MANPIGLEAAMVSLATAMDRLATSLEALNIGFEKVANTLAEASADAPKMPSLKTADTPAPETKAAASESKVTQEDVREAARALVNSQGKDAVTNALKPFGAAKVSDLKDDQLEAALKAFQNADI